jgi:hypothetical protein
MNPQVWERDGKWYVEGYDDIGFGTKDGALEYYALHLNEEKTTRRSWRWPSR